MSTAMISCKHGKFLPATHVEVSGHTANKRRKLPPLCSASSLRKILGQANQTTTAPTAILAKLRATLPSTSPISCYPQEPTTLTIVDVSRACCEQTKSASAPGQPRHTDNCQSMGLANKATTAPTATLSKLRVTFPRHPPILRESEGRGLLVPMQENLPFYYRHYLRMRNKHQCKAIKEKDNSGLHGWQQNHVPRERHRSLGGLTRWRHSPGGWPLAIMNAFHQHGETSTYDVALVLIHEKIQLQWTAKL